MTDPTALAAKDAKSRALRTLLQGLAFDMGAAATLVIFTSISRADSWGDLQWALLGWALFKTVSVAGLSYLMRRVFAPQAPQA